VVVDPARSRTKGGSCPENLVHLHLTILEMVVDTSFDFAGLDDAINATKIG
jgi:hypothetical protein